MALTWEEKLEKLMLAKFGHKKALAIIKKYRDRIPASYIEKVPVELALRDLGHVAHLSQSSQLDLIFYPSSDPEYPLHLRLYLWQAPMPLSDILPIFDNLNLRIYNDHSFKINLDEYQSIWICDFAVAQEKSNQLTSKETPLFFKEAFKIIYFGLAENDGFNKLILAAGLEWREVFLLRAYAKYLHQINFRYSQFYIVKALVKNAELIKELVNFFKEMHDPASKKSDKLNKREQCILTKLESVQSLDEDRILRQFLNLIKATVRTNYFQQTKQKKPKDYLSFKFDSQFIIGIPLPIPLYEIFVYSPQLEGIHLRHAKVARGGIRWSERPEDFRTEILGLMKVQTIKNAVIVPSGAKGGFIIKKPADTREERLAEILSCYKIFICGLLDLTDNIKNNRIVHPKQVVCYDDYDPYLVVAADKGTASFSDMANDLSFKYDFWLGDAFASGGSTGYDHKKMGITAKGAWESVKRHFIELKVDLPKSHIKVIGIGDMSGDVFGNAMIYSKRIKLVAAFDHRNIFIDPDPIPEVSYKERVRLFKLPTSSWEDYQAQLISTGGGVFRRTEKSIPLSKQIKKLLRVSNNALAPDDLIRAILKAPAHLLFNGGIGTYVKASTETNLEVGDRANDWCRVNGNEVRADVVVEGGNLGFTQPARIEYALKGGLIFTDSIDNSAGVDCSDHEVNLKILLNHQVKIGKLTEKKRNELLFAATDEVSNLVLTDNADQALLISYSEYRAKANLPLHIEYMKYMELQGQIDRAVDYLPDEKTLIERRSEGLGLTRPELAVLSAYTKIAVKKEVLNSYLPEDPLLMHIVETAFPASICKKYKAAMEHHPLRRDIVATQLSNQVVNEMGITFVYRLQRELGATVGEIVKAHALASQIYKTTELQGLIFSLDFKISPMAQYEMLYNIRNLINIATRWFLHSNYLQDDVQKVINQFSPHIKTLEKITPNLMGGVIKQYLTTLTKQFLSLGLPAETAHRIATYRTMYSALNIIEVVIKNKFELVKSSKVYYAVGERFHLLWFRDQIGNDNRDGHWNNVSRLTIRDELDIAQRALTVAVLKIDDKEPDVSVLIDKWIAANQRLYLRWEKLIEELNISSNVDYPMIFIVIRELIQSLGQQSKEVE